MAGRKQIHMLNQRQLAWMIATMLIAGGLVSLPKTLIEVAKLDAWFSHLFGVTYAFLIAAFLYQCARKFPGKNLFDIVFELCGRVGGGVLNAALLFYIWMTLIRDIRAFADFMNSTLLQKTPEEFIILLFLLLVVYYCKSSVEVIARVNDLMFPLFLVVLFTMPLLLTNEFSFQRLEPILGNGLWPVVEGNILPVGWYGDSLFVGAFLHTVSTSRQIKSAFKFGVLLSTVGLTLLLFMCICVLGSSVAARMMYPSYTLVEQIHITDYLDRLELVMFSVWLPAFVLKVCFIFTAMLVGLNSFTKRTDQKLYNRQIGWFLQVTSLMAFHSAIEVFDFGNFGSLFNVAFVEVPVIVLLLVLLARRKTNEMELKTDRAIREQEQKQAEQENAKWYDRITEKTWARITMGLLASCYVWIGAGSMFGMDSDFAGGLCGAGYILAVLAMLFTTYMEMRQVRVNSIKPEMKSKQERRLA